MKNYVLHLVRFFIYVVPRSERFSFRCFLSRFSSTRALRFPFLLSIRSLAPLLFDLFCSLNPTTAVLRFCTWQWPGLVLVSLPALYWFMCTCSSVFRQERARSLGFHRCFCYSVILRFGCSFSAWIWSSFRFCYLRSRFPLWIYFPSGLCMVPAQPAWDFHSPVRASRSAFSLS
jgi:hypothetical protein